MSTFRITLTSVIVDDTQKAEAFYTEKLGFVVRHNVPLGEELAARLGPAHPPLALENDAKLSALTVVSPIDPDGTELLLEPSGHPAAAPFKEALYTDGIPWTQCTVDGVQTEYDRLVDLGVQFTQPPLEAGGVTTAVLDDTCGNLIQIIHQG